MPLDPQFNDIIAMMRAMPPLSTLPIEMIRSAPVPENPNPTPVDAVRNETIPGPGGKMPIRIYRKGTGTLPLLLFIHGGGFVVGSPDTHDEMARALTAQTGCVTVSVDYRLGPEHPYPAAPDDCFAALKWAFAHARDLGADAARMAVAGDSAGGNLAAVMALRARDEGGPALKAQLLIYPVTDMTAELKPAPDGEFYIINPQETGFFHRSYLGDGARKREPYASPAFAKSLRGLPPALVIVAEYDPLCPQGEAYAKRLKDEGVETELVNYKAAPHGFMSFPVPMGKEGLAQSARWLKPRLV